MFSRPPRFEDEYPSAAAFLMRTFAAGGALKLSLSKQVALTGEPDIVKVRRNSECPCGSGKKTKRCHDNWL